MKSKKKLLLLSLLSVTSLVSAISILFVYSNEVSIIRSYCEPYGIMFNSSKNKFFLGTGSTDYSGQAIVKTNNENDIQFQYYSIAGGSSSVWHLVKNGGYFYNTNPIHGLESLSISSTTADKEYRISWGKDLNFDLGNCNFLSSTSSVLCNFNNDHPTYFKFENISGSNISIKEMSLSLDCYNYYPVVSLSANYSERGTVSGGGTKQNGESVTINASPNTGYKFVGWYDGTSLISSNSSYTFTIGDQDLSYIAKFECESYNLLVESESLEKGFVSESSGSYDYMSQVTIEAVANNGYSFIGWYDGESLVNNNNPYSFTIPYNNVSLTAKFSLNSYTLTLINENSSLGSITGNGEFDYGSNVTITATPITGVAFSGWFDDNDNLVSDLESYSFTMPYSNLTLTAKFEWSPLTMFLSVNDGDMGSVSGSGTYHYGQSVVLHAFPNEHYSFFGWYNNDELLSQESSLSFNMPNNSLSYEARFVRNHNLVIYSDNEEMGTVISSSECGEGLEVTIHAVPNEGYSFDYWCDENYDEISYDEDYSFTMPSNDVEIIAVFSLYKELLILDSNFSDEVVTFHGQGKHILNTQVTISSEAIEGLVFDGWYTEDYKLVSNANLYTFTFTGSTSLIAYYHYSAFNFSFSNIDASAKTCSVSGYSGTLAENIYFPKLYNGNRVTAIGGFSGCSSLVSAVIPDGVNTIYGSAFYNCTSLTSIVIPDSVSNIYSYAFSGCSSLLSIDLPNGISTLYGGTFSNCTSLTSVVIPDGVTSLAGFSNCTSLTSVVIPDSVVTIGSSAFYNCSLLTQVVIPDSVTSIGGNAFLGCSSIYSIIIPSKVTYINADAFSKCFRLAEVINKSSLNIVAGSTLNGRVAQYAKQVIKNESDSKICIDNDFILYIDNDDISLVGYLGNESHITVPEGVTSINNNAFNECKSLISIEIPVGVTSIGNYSFSNCQSLTSVTLSNGLISIGDYAFNACYNLDSITIPDSVVTIGEYAFASCTALTSVTISNNLTSTGRSVFYYCTSLASVTIPGSLSIIETNMFLGCSSLTSVTISEGVISIMNAAFASCTSLTSVTLPSTLASIDKNAFSSCSSLSSCIIPISVTTMGEYVFKNCSGGMTIYCEAESQPSGWNSNWYKRSTSEANHVVWGYHE